MHDVGTIVGFGVLAIGVVLSRIMSERAFRTLDDPMKIAIMNEFSGMRIWNVVPLLAIVILMVAGNAYYVGHGPIVLSLSLAAIAVYFIITHRMIRAKMLKVRAPETYLRTFTQARWVSYLSVFLMLAAMLGAQIVHGVSNTASVSSPGVQGWNSAGDHE